MAGPACRTAHSAASACSARTGVDPPGAAVLHTRRVEVLTSGRPSAEPGLPGLIGLRRRPRRVRRTTERAIRAPQVKGPNFMTHRHGVPRRRSSSERVPPRFCLGVESGGSGRSAALPLRPDSRVAIRGQPRHGRQPRPQVCTSDHRCPGAADDDTPCDQRCTGGRRRAGGGVPRRRRGLHTGGGGCPPRLLTGRRSSTAPVSRGSLRCPWAAG